MALSDFGRCFCPEGETLTIGISWTSLVAQLVKNPPAMQEPPMSSWVGKICWKRDRLPTLIFLAFPCGSAGKEFTCNAGDLGSILGLGRSPGEGKGYPLQYSGLENSMDCIVHGVTKSWTLRDFHFLFILERFQRANLRLPPCEGTVRTQSSKRKQARATHQIIHHRHLALCSLQNCEK